MVLIASGADHALPDAWVALACVPALLVGHRFGAAVFRRLDDASHHRVGARRRRASPALLSIGAAALI